MAKGPGEVRQAIEDESDRVEEVQQQSLEAAPYFVGRLGTWGMGVGLAEDTASSCGQEGCLVKSGHEHERSVDERLRQLRRINADFERRHPSLKEA